MASVQFTPAPPAAASTRAYWLLAAAISFVGSVAGGLWGIGLLASFLAFMLLCICAYPAIRYVKRREGGVPAVPILCGAYAIQFALPVFLGDRTLWLIGGWKDVGYESLILALVVANASIAAFVAISYSRIAKRLVAALPTLDLHLNRTRALAYVLITALLGLFAPQVFALLSLDTQAQYGAIGRLLQNQVLVGIGVLAWLTYGSRAVWLRALYYVIVAGAAITGAATGFLEAAVAPIGIMFACQWLYRRRINMTLAVALLGAMLLLNPVKGEFREAVWYSESPGAEVSKVAKAMLWIQTGVGYWSDVLDGRVRGRDAVAQLLSRTSMIDILAVVVETTPDSVPYLGGETYSYFAYSLIPRAFWPEKPVASANKTLAVEYGLTTAEGAERSTFGVSLIGEGYANFGWIGSILVMALFAVVLLALQRVFTTPRSGPGGYALFLCFFIYFLNGLGSSLEILLGNLLQNIVVSYLILYWVIDHRPDLRKVALPR